MNSRAIPGMEIVLAACTILAIAGGCGGGGSGNEDTITDPDVVADATDSTGDADATDVAGEGDTSGDAGCTPPATDCNGLTPIGTLVEEIQVDTDAPALTGGTVVAGTYNLTTDTYYTGAGGATGPTGMAKRIQLVLTAGTFELAAEVHGGSGCVMEEMSGGYTTDASSMTFSLTCPGSGGEPFPYEATSTGITMEMETDRQAAFTLD